MRTILLTAFAFLMLSAVFQITAEAKIVSGTVKSVNMATRQMELVTLQGTQVIPFDESTLWPDEISVPEELAGATVSIALDPGSSQADIVELEESSANVAAESAYVQ